MQRVIAELRAPSRAAPATRSAAASPSRIQRGHDTGSTGLPPAQQRAAERLSGVALDDVVVHHRSSEPSRIGALAYTHGAEILLAPGQERHLPHETWHVVQQKQGRVRPTAWLGARLAVNDDVALELEADTMGAAVAAGAAADRAPAAAEPAVNPVAPVEDVVQGKWFRMSSRFDDEDDRVIARINDLVSDDHWLEGFWQVVEPFKELAQSFRQMGEIAQQHAYVGQAVDRILASTFFEEGKAYTASEVVELLETDLNERYAPEPDDPRMDELITLFSQLTISIPFRSDLDKQTEDHAVSLQKGDIIVQSNPKPLKDVLTAGVWEGYPLSPAVIVQLTALRKTAKLALYKISGHTGRGIKGSRTQTKFEALRIALKGIARVFATFGGAGHQATLAMRKTDLSGSDDYGSNAWPTEGTHVVARPLSIRSSTGGSKPNDGRLMQSIRNLAGPERKSYKQMHLLNDLVFGPGELWNLTPGPAQSNSDMEHQVEDPLKRAVLGKGLVINFEARVTYKNDPTAASDKQISQAPDSYRFQRIDFTAEQLDYDPTTSSWQVAAHPDPDVAAVDGSRILWKYGSLTPLVPKPRILDPNTTWQELNAVGLKPAVAKRIVAFIQNNPGWTPKGKKDKKDQLLLAVKASEGKGARKPNADWDATAVYWT